MAEIVLSRTAARGIIASSLHHFITEYLVPILIAQGGEDTMVSVANLGNYTTEIAVTRNDEDEEYEYVFTVQLKGAA